MHIRLFLIAALSLSVSCFAEPGRNQPKPLPESDQAKSAPIEGGQPAQIEAEKETAESQSAQETGLSKQSLMIDYCRKHTC